MILGRKLAARRGRVAAITFLWLNDVATDISEADLVSVILALAAGELSDADLAAWFRDHIEAA